MTTDEELNNKLSATYVQVLNTMNPDKAASEILADQMMVSICSTAMLNKLRKKRTEGRGGWWVPDKCEIKELIKMLYEHVNEKDPDLIDIMNFAGMIYARLLMADLLKAGEQPDDD